MKKLSVIFFCTIMVMLLSAWVFLPVYIQSAANHLLNKHGIRVTRLVVERPDFDRIIVNRLNVMIQGADGPLRLTASDIDLTIKYYPFAIDTVSIAHLDIEAQIQAQKKVQQSEDMGLTQLDYSLQNLPISHISIDRIAISAPALSPYFPPMRLRAHHNLKQTQVTLASDDNQLIKLVAHIKDDHEKTRVSLDGTLDLDAYRPLLQLLHPMSNGIQLGDKTALLLTTESRLLIDKKNINHSHAHIDWQLVHPNIDTPDWQLSANRLQGQLTIQQQNTTLRVSGAPLAHIMLKKQLLTTLEHIPDELAVTLSSKQFLLKLKSDQMLSEGQLDLQLTGQYPLLNSSLSQLALHGMNARKKTLSAKIAGQAMLYQMESLGLPLKANTLTLTLAPEVLITPDKLTLNLVENSQAIINDIVVPQQNTLGKIPTLTLSASPQTDVVHFDRVQNSLDLLKLRAQYQTDAIMLYHNHRELLSHQHSGTLHLSNNEAVIQHQLSVPDANSLLTIPMRWTQKTNQLTGTFNLNQDNTLLSSVDRSALIEDGNTLITALEGDLAIDGNFKVNLAKPDSLRASARGHLDKLAFTMGENRFAGVDMPFRLTLNGKNYSLASQLQIEQLTITDQLTIKHFKTQSLLKNGLVEQSTTHFKAFGSLFEVAAFSFPLDKPDFTTHIKVADLSLQNVASIAQVDGLKVKGKVGGELPVRFADGRFTIEHGLLKNIQSGHIQYRPDGSLDTVCLDLNNITNLQKYALQNFHFNKLSVQLFYDGHLTIRAPVRLEGNNPNFCQGRAIIINVNPDYELPENFWVYFLLGENFLENIKQFDKNQQDRD